MPRVLTAACALWCAAVLCVPAGAARAQSAELAEAERLLAEAVTLAAKEKFDEARPLAERAVALREQALGPDHVLVADALGQLAGLLYAKRKYREAESLLRRQLTIYEKAPAQEAAPANGALHLYLCVLHDARRKDESVEVMRRIFRLENGFDLPAERDASARRTGEVLPTRALHKPAPSYPVEARNRRVTGAVLMKVIVDEAGAVSSIKALCGPPELRQAAVQAAAQNRYEPYAVGGRPVAVKGFITYNFSIQ